MAYPIKNLFIFVKRNNLEIIKQSLLYKIRNHKVALKPKQAVPFIHELIKFI